jgi:hypothetical protein
MPRCSDCDTEYADDLDECPGCSNEARVERCVRCGEDFEGLDACPACGHACAAFACERHLERRAEGRCVICGRPLCRDCNRSEGRAYRCSDHSGVTVIQGWAQIYSTASEFEAGLLRENLRAEGIETRVFSQKDNMLSVDLGELSIVRLLVPAWDYSQAEEVIRQHMDRQGEVTFACPECGEAYEPGTTSCSGCGYELGPGEK